jgi:hypothetical protein
VPFAVDWLGRHLALDTGRPGDDGELELLLLDPGAGEALEIPCGFADFHEQELVEHADAALASDFFRAWAAANARELPLAVDHCVGYRVPLFLGGADVIDNVELTDTSTYWELMAQLRQGTATLTDGTRITDVEISDH